jgi:DNA-binding CsgD family transcriptional regulator
MILTRKQQAVLRLRRAGHGPTAIARETGLARETVSRLLSRAKRNLRQAGIDPDKVFEGEKLDLLELAM